MSSVITQVKMSFPGGMAEWFKAAVLKTAFRFPERGFESLSLRQPEVINSDSNQVEKFTFICLILLETALT